MWLAGFEVISFVIENGVSMRCTHSLNTAPNGLCHHYTTVTHHIISKYIYNMAQLVEESWQDAMYTSIVIWEQWAPLNLRTIQRYTNYFTYLPRQIQLNYYRHWNTVNNNTNNNNNETDNFYIHIHGQTIMKTLQKSDEHLTVAVTSLVVTSSLLFETVQQMNMRHKRFTTRINAFKTLLKTLLKSNCIWIHSTFSRGINHIWVTQ